MHKPSAGNKKGPNGPLVLTAFTLNVKNKLDQ